MKGLGLAILSSILIFHSSLAQAQPPVCPSETLQDVSLYLNEGGCWAKVPDNGAFEPDDQRMIDTAVNSNRVSRYRVGRSRRAEFLFALQRAPGYETAVVIKERIFRPASIVADQSNNLHGAGATSTVHLERPAIINSCGQWSALANGSVSVNVYNRYHMDRLGAIQQTGDLRRFHYQYRRKSSGHCVATTEINSGNREQYAYKELNVEPSTVVARVARRLRIVGPALAENSVYTHLTTRNLFLKPVRDERTPQFGIIRFNTGAEPYNRLVLTAIDLEEHNSDNYHKSHTWEIDWAP